MEKTYDRVNREALWQVLRMYDVGSKHFGGIRSVYVDNSARVRVKAVEAERFRIDSGGEKGLYLFPLPFQCIYGWNDEGDEDGDRKEGNETPGGGERLVITWPLVCR